VFTVYVLKSTINGRLYIGYTEDLDNRLKEHNRGKTKSTKAYKPYLLAYKETFDNITDARKRENLLKSGRGRKFLKSIISPL